MGPLEPPRRLLMGSGPSNPAPRVLRAMASPPFPPGSTEDVQLNDDIACMLRTVFQAPHATPVVVAGASRAGLEAALASLVEPGDRVLVGVYGHFGELLCTLAARHGALVERVDANWGSIIDPGALVARLRRPEGFVKLVAIVHADTSTGMAQPLAQIGHACNDTGTFLLVDTVLSLGGCEVDVDSWGVDVAIGGLQKCLGGPPGLAPVVVSDRAWQVLGQRKTPPHSAYLDLRRQAHHYGTPMVLALREALRAIDEESLEARWQRHTIASRALREGLMAMGLELFGDPNHRVPMITLVRVPDGVSEPAVRQQLLDRHGVEIMAAFGPLRGQVWRIGTMGINASQPAVLQVLSALESVLARQGFRGLPERGAAVDAAQRVYDEAGARGE